jgi:hypothetical protein
VRGSDVLNSEVVRGLLAHLRAGISPHDDEAFEAASRGPPRRLGAAFWQNLREARDALYSTEARVRGRCCLWAGAMLLLLVGHACRSSQGQFCSCCLPRLMRCPLAVHVAGLLQPGTLLGLSLAPSLTPSPLHSSPLSGLPLPAPQHVSLFTLAQDMLAGGQLDTRQCNALQRYLGYMEELQDVLAGSTPQGGSISWLCPLHSAAWLCHLHSAACCPCC